MIAKPSPANSAQVASELVAFPSRNGRQIIGFIDRSEICRSEGPFVIMAPKYGETKKNNLQLAYLLAANGLSVLRFDLTCHVGESEGPMSEFTLSGAVEDLCGGVDFLEGRFGARRIVSLASSLSARSAIRAAVIDERLAGLVVLVGVLNLQHTLREVYHEDIIGTYLQGRHWGLTDILGFDINGETFLGDAVRSGMHDFDGTCEDLAKSPVPITYFWGEQDPWVSALDVRRALAERPRTRLIMLEGAMHEIRENPGAGERAFARAASACLGYAGLADPDSFPAFQPDRKSLFFQNRRERERLRKTLPAGEAEQEFWSRYLGRYSLLEKADDYREYLDAIGRLLGDFRPGEVVLDAGCGNGLFGSWMIRRLAETRPGPPGLPVVYLGLDLTEGGLSDALARHLEAGGGSSLGTAGGRQPMLGYGLFDFDGLRGAAGGAARRLPFLEGTFDRICCSLVISYVRRPRELVAELHRVLKPGGVLVLSSMKPFCDLSAIYRGFISQQVTPADVEAARNLLRAAGQIRLKEETGKYSFYYGEELAELALQAGFRRAAVHRSLGNQVNLIRALK